MKRVLIVTRNFPPLWGGMERLNRHLVDELSRRFDVRLIAPAGAKDHVSAEVKVLALPLKPLPWFLLQAAWQALRQAFVWKPDVVIGGSGLVAPIVLLAARIGGARAVTYVHGLDLAVPHILYRLLWRPALRRLDAVIANSSPTAQLAHDIGILDGRISVVHPGVAIPDRIDSSTADSFRAAHHLGTGPILLSVGRLTERKGLSEFVRQVLPKVATAYPAAKLVVIGDAPTDALYANVQSIQSIQDAANAAGVGESIHFLGKRFGKELEAAYMAADVHVFPVRQISGDPEGFGMVAVEAAAHGLPTVAYAVGGVTDAVADGISGRLIESGDADSFADAVVALIDEPLNRNSIRGFSRQFAWPEFGKKVTEVIDANLRCLERRHENR